ncbi:MAG: SbcC/MukB-like Walker B domain-containing protein [Streptosporangiaceae bacterium]
MTASHSPKPARFKPTRAGIINLWDYFDEEFAFGDGRLALRGHNGSGKTKALEVLFPFVLDGGLDARRLDPFSGENRTMKANLLYRGQDAEHGYVWMEFGRPADGTELARPTGPGERQETVTLVIGLTAHKNWERARPSFFITGQRMGVDFGLLSADSRPLTAKQLTAILGRDASFGDRRGAYTGAVDARLFGLGRERYAQLLDLLIALRRPLLAKDLDPVKVSGTLSAGLSPVDEDLVEQAARDFENLAAVQKQYDDLAAADAAVRAFLTQYTAYLRAHTRHQVDQVTARADAAAGHVGAIITAVREAAAAGRQEQQAREAGESARISVDTFGARLSALKDRDAYKDHEKLALRRGQLEQDKARLGQDQQRLASARANVDSLQQEADAVASHRDELGRALGRHLQALAGSAAGAGLLRDGEPADTGADLAMTAKARVTARRDDIAEVRGRLASVREAEHARKLAETELGKARQALDDCDQACRDAEQGLAAARADVAGHLRGWATRWAGDQPSAILDEPGLDALAVAVGRIGEPDAATLTETFTALTQARTDTLISRREQLTSREAQLASEQEQRTAERHKIASQHDDAPPASDLRPADRAGRPGAPFWQLVRFADGQADEAAAAIEGALYGAGLLTAWIHPDPAQTTAAVAGAEADGYLLAAPPEARPAGRTLADVLVPEQQDLVPPAVVEGVLRSVFVADEVNGGDEAGGTREPGGTGPGGAAMITLRAQYRSGLQLGARPKAAPEFIGATARASRRRARLAELDRLIADLGRQREDLAAQRQRAVDLLADLGRAQQELPRTAPVTEALGQLTSAEGQRTGARARLAGAQETLDRATAELDARARRLRHAAADRGLPARADEVDTVERAVADFARAAGDLVRTRGEMAALEQDLHQRLDRISHLTSDNTEAAELLAENQALYVAGAEKLSVDERVSGAEYEQIRDEILDAEHRLSDARADRKAAGVRESGAHDKVVGAERDLSHGRSALAAAMGELITQAAAFEPYTQGDLRPLLEVTESAPWPAAAQWPEAQRIADELVDRLMAGEGTAGEGADPGQVIREVLPGAAGTVLDAFAAATRAGRAVTEGVLKGTVDRMWTAYRDFETSLKSGEDGYQADLAGDAPFYVDVVTNEGRVPAASFARKIAEDVENQGILLEQRERTVLEDSLLTALAQQIHSRVLAAKDLVDQMDADTRSKPMSSGMAVGIRWVRSDKLTDQQARVSRLLDRDAAGLGADGLAELRGLLRAMIHDHRAANPRDTYREVLGSVLDYRSWHTFELRLLQPGRPAERLTRKKHSEMSGGEKSAAIHLPLFAAANALYSSSKPDCPRLIALDEAFAGIDDTFKPELLGLTVKFDLDLFMTGHDLWVTYPTVPVIAHYDMQHDKAAHTLSTLLALWDGEQLLDAGAGFAGNEELAAELLGFRPSRYVPAGVGDVLQLGSGSGGDDGGEDENDEDGG